MVICFLCQVIQLDILLVGIQKQKNLNTNQKCSDILNKTFIEDQKLFSGGSEKMKSVPID